MEYLTVENLLICVVFLGALGNAISLLPFAATKKLGSVLVEIAKRVQGIRK